MTANEKRAHKQAAQASKTGAPRYVVYVFDEGYDVYTGEQVRLWSQLILVEALYVDGALVAGQEIAARIATLGAAA